MVRAGRMALAYALVPALALAFLLAPASAAPKKDFKVAWSIYTGYIPWAYAEHSGILKKWADKYGITIKAVQFNDYVESVNQYTSGDFDAVATTAIDSLTIPAVGGVDSTIMILGDYTNGNDAIFMKGEGKTLADLKGQNVHLVEYSVSHYMLWLALQKAGLGMKDVKTSNISDADFVAAFQQPDVQNIVAWNPATSQIRTMPRVSTVFNSAEIPGEILDVVTAKTAVLKENPGFGEALAGAWFEAVAVLAGTDAKAQDALKFMASVAGTTPEDFASQVKTTYFYDAPEATALLRSGRMSGMADKLLQFSFENALLGANAKSKDAVGIALPDGTVVGDAGNIKLRFDDSYMKAVLPKAP